MELSDLQVFLAVARTGGITRAATDLHTVQSNISTRIAGLEKELGVQLFRRHSRGVALTRAGEQFHGYAQRIAALAQEARQVVRDETPCGPLRIGAMETTAGLRLPRVLSSFTAEWPDVDLSLVTGTTDALVRAVLDHELDGALVAGPVNHADIHEQVVFAEQLVLITARCHRTLDEALHGSTSPRLLVFRSGCSYRRRLEAVVRSRGVVPDRVLEYGTVEGIIGCVAAGLGVTLLPRPLVEQHERAQAVRIHRLADTESTVDTVFVRRSDAPVTSALREFVRQISSADDESRVVALAN
jgi:DNA-binding transcriptional LysR family regulator